MPQERRSHRGPYRDASGNRGFPTRGGRTVNSRQECLKLVDTFRMNYGLSGSGAQSDRIPEAITSHFRYQDGCVTRHREGRSHAEWFAIMKAEIDAGRPLYYQLDPFDSGLHAVVCDGYKIDAAGNWLHFNYGWNDGHTDYYVVTEVGENQVDDMVVIYIAPRGWRTTTNPDLNVCEPKCAAWGDFNGDRYPDLYVGYGPAGRLFRNDRNGGLLLSSVPAYLGVGVRASAWADANRDGYDDLLVVGESGIAVARGGYSGLNPTGVTFDFAPGSCRSCAWGDLNSDGVLDIIVGSDAHGVVIFRGVSDAGTSYIRVASPRTGVAVASVAVVDFDGDSNLDLTVSEGTSGDRFYTGDGLGNFQLLTNADSGLPSSSHAWGDIDNDGNLDRCRNGIGQPALSQFGQRTAPGYYDRESALLPCDANNVRQFCRY